MRSRSSQLRHLDAVLSTDDEQPAQKAALEDATEAGVEIPREFNAHQYLIFLLRIAAEIEHCLMVQYLYAGFSLGGPSVGEKLRDKVVLWQETVLGIAKEEMGHLLTVQNLLRCLGGPLNLDREDYPWDSQFLPFPFRLEPLTRQSLAKYIVAESPEAWTGREAAAIRAEAASGLPGGGVKRIGVLYSLISRLLIGTGVKDSDFREWTHSFQANWDEWGRSYQGGRRGNATGQQRAGTPNVLISAIVSRTSAVEAIKALTTQGEANAPDDEGAPSHFARFLDIYRHFPRDHRHAVRDVPVNPVANEGDDDQTVISHPLTRLWANLFNVRYRFLLAGLLHSFDFPSNLAAAGQHTPRGLLIHTTFGEMYHLRALAQILMRLPLGPDEKRTAGPPFQMPYTVDLPFDAVDRWRLHLDLIETSRRIVDELLASGAGANQDFLRALRAADEETAGLVQRLLLGRQEPSVTDRLMEFH